MSLTTDPKDPGLRRLEPSGMQEKYLVLSEEERAKGFVRPLRRAYRHAACGVVTRMGDALCETYARDPGFYGGTFCCGCGTHLPLFTYVEAPLDVDDLAAGRVLHREVAFRWVEDNQPVGS